MIKKLASLFLAISMVLALHTPSFAANDTDFQKINTYQPGQFSDVSATDWYAENVKITYEYGLMT